MERGKNADRVTPAPPHRGGGIIRWLEAAFLSFEELLGIDSPSGVVREKMEATLISIAADCQNDAALTRRIQAVFGTAIKEHLKTYIEVCRELEEKARYEKEQRQYRMIGKLLSEQILRKESVG